MGFVTLDIFTRATCATSYRIACRVHGRTNEPRRRRCCGLNELLLDIVAAHAAAAAAALIRLKYNRNQTIVVPNYYWLRLEMDIAGT